MFEEFASLEVQPSLFVKFFPRLVLSAAANRPSFLTKYTICLLLPLSMESTDHIEVCAAEQSPSLPEDKLITSVEDLAECDCDPEMGTWLLDTLRRIQPDAEITVGSVKVSLHSPLAPIQFSNDHLPPLSTSPSLPFPLLQQILSNLLDQVTTTVLQEASAISSGQETADLPGTSGLSSSSDHSTAQQTTTSRRGGLKRMPLTSLDIHKALKRVLPGEPGELFRPYLPTVTKQAWHLDKQSLKGIKGKKQKTMMQAPPVILADDHDEDDEKTEQDVVGLPATTEEEAANGVVTEEDIVE